MTRSDGDEVYVNQVIKLSQMGLQNHQFSIEQVSIDLVT